MNRLPFFKRKQKSNSFEQLLTATAVKSTAINIDFIRLTLSAAAAVAFRPIKTGY